MCYYVSYVNQIGGHGCMLYSNVEPTSLSASNRNGCASNADSLQKQLAGFNFIDTENNMHFLSLWTHSKRYGGLGLQVAV